MRSRITATILFAWLAHVGCSPDRQCEVGTMQTRHEFNRDYCWVCAARTVRETGSGAATGGCAPTMFSTITVIDWMPLKSVACDQEEPPTPPLSRPPCTAAQSPATCECHETCGPVVGLQRCMPDGTWSDCEGCGCAPDLSVPDLGPSDA